MVAADATPAVAGVPAARKRAGGCNTCGCGDCRKLTCPDQTVERLFGNVCWLKCHDITVQGWIGRLCQLTTAVATLTVSTAPTDSTTGMTNPGQSILHDHPEGSARHRLLLGLGFHGRPTGGHGLSLSDLQVAWMVRTMAGRTWNFDTRNFYGLAMPQAYLEFGTSCLSYKIGHMYTLLGNEVVPALGNVFYSHTYSFLYAYRPPTPVPWPPISRTIN